MAYHSTGGGNWLATTKGVNHDATGDRSHTWSAGCLPGKRMILVRMVCKWTTQGDRSEKPR